MKVSDHSQICEHRSCNLVISFYHWLDTEHYRIDLKDVRAKLSEAGAKYTRHLQQSALLVARRNDSLQRRTMTLRCLHSLNIVYTDT